MTMYPCFNFRAVLCAVLLWQTPACLAAQDSLRVEFPSSSDWTARISSQINDGTVYVPASELAPVLGLTLVPLATPNKLEMNSPAGRVQLIADNPFISAGESGKRPAIRQLVHPVLRDSSSWYVPLDDFLATALPVLHIQADFDQAKNLLHIGPPKVQAPQFDITTVSMESKSNGMILRIPLARKLNHVEHWLRQDGWLYVTVADARIDVETLNALKPEGFIRKITAIQAPGSAQLAFRLGVPVDSEELTGDPTTGEIVLTVRTPASPPPATQTARPATPVVQPPPMTAPGTSPDVISALEQRRDRWALDVIVIDAGHGGRDPGATGVTGAKEKNITLGVALKLGKLIRKNLPGVKVVYTRDSDKFVELDKRGKIANDAEGKLFISIHCNAMPRKPSKSRGFEVYLLRPGRTDEAVSIAERENAVIQMEEGYEERYKKLTDENFILVTMAQSAHVKASEVFADILQKQMEDHAGIPNRGVKQAGFYVLVGASMPNVLVETAYLSNREDEKILKSDAGQLRIAESICRAVKAYKGEYEKLLNEGKELGEMR